MRINVGRYRVGLNGHSDAVLDRNSDTKDNIKYPMVDAVLCIVYINICVECAEVFGLQRLLTCQTQYSSIGQ